MHFRTSCFNVLFSKANQSFTGLLLFLVILLSLSSVVSAQTIENFDQIKSEAALARLSDSQLRELLLQRLNSVTAEPTQNSGFDLLADIEQLPQRFGIVQARLVEIIGVRHRIKEEFDSAWSLVSGEDEGGTFLSLVLITLTAFLLAWIAEKTLYRFLQPARQMLITPQAQDSVASLITRLTRLGSVLGFRLVGIFLFAIVAALIYFILSSGDSEQRVAFFFYLTALLLVRLVSAFVSLFYAVNYPAFRLPFYNDNEAQGMHRGLVITIILSAFGFFTCELIRTLGLKTDAHPLLLISVGNMYVIALSITVFLFRRAIVHDIRAQSPEESFRYVLASAWPWTIIITTLFIWAYVVFTALSGDVPLYGAAIFTTGVMLFYPTIDASMEREAMRAKQADEEILVAIMRSVRFVACIILFIIVASAWRINLYSAVDDSIGAKFTAASLQIFLVLFIAYIVWQATRIWIDRKIAIEDAMHAEEVGGDIGEMEIGGAGLSRLRTLLPLLKLTIRITLGTIVMMLILSTLGIDIAPVLAGAGVIGLAIGFGSQTLVRDVVSGGFFLIDDALRLGEYVDVGEVKGVVEKIQIRSLRLRHHLGAVHTVPFGEIVRLTNFSRDWTIMKLKFRVPFDTDIEKLRKVLKKVGQELLEHPEVGEDFLQPLKSQGVLETDDYGLVVRAKFMCKPGSQYLIRRYAFMAVQKAFEENDIEFALPEIRVVNADEDSSEQDAGAAALAATKPKPGEQQPNPA